MISLVCNFLYSVWGCEVGLGSRWPSSGLQRWGICELGAVTFLHTGRKRFHFSIKKEFFTVKSVEMRNTQDLVLSSLVHCFKSGLDVFLMHKV